jgi:uncharacterized membrane protein
LTGQSLPPNQNLYVRARGYYGAGIYDGSGSIVESIRNVYVRVAPPFSDDPLVAGVTAIRAAHIAELRARIDAVRARYGLAAFPYTNGSIIAGTSVVMAVDVSEMRAALAQAYTSGSLPPPTYTDPGLGAGTIVKAVHIAELRSALLAIE